MAETVLFGEIIRPEVYLAKFFICGSVKTFSNAGRYEDTTEGYSTIGIMKDYENGGGMKSERTKSH